MATEVIHTLKASGGDYTLMSTWEATEQRDLVAADEIEILECYNDWPDGLDDPTAKMSKSGDKQGHALHLLDPPNVLRKTIMRATTDSENRIVFDQNKQPGIHNLLTIYQALTNQSEAEILTEFAGQGYGTLKKRVADIVIANINTICVCFLVTRHTKCPPIFYGEPKVWVSREGLYVVCMEINPTSNPFFEP